MRNFSKKGFTLVELLVVITILAIISVIAYQNFGWAVWKAVSWRKIQDVSTIETALQQYKADNNYYPATEINSTTNLFWYNSGATAQQSNSIKVTYSWQEIATIVTADTKWGWVVYWIWTWATWWSQRQIWAKWTISQTLLWKKYLSKDLYDPELWDLKINNIWWWNSWKMIDLWLWRYVYATFKKNTWNWKWSSNFNWNAYNIAYTVRKEWSDTYITKIVWDYDAESCYDDKAFCPNTLIWLSDKEEQNWTSESANYHIPYAVTDFKQ